MSCWTTAQKSSLRKWLAERGPAGFLLAGRPDGAGKSSLYRAAVADGLLPADAEFINADLHEGGHDVPAERVLARYPRTLKNLTLAVRQVDLAMPYDNGSAAGAGRCEQTRACGGLPGAGNQSVGGPSAGLGDNGVGLMGRRGPAMATVTSGQSVAQGLPQAMGFRSTLQGERLLMAGGGRTASRGLYQPPAMSGRTWRPGERLLKAGCGHWMLPPERARVSKPVIRGTSPQATACQPRPVTRPSPAK